MLILQDQHPVVWGARAADCARTASLLCGTVIFHRNAEEGELSKPRLVACMVGLSFGLATVWTSWVMKTGIFVMIIIQSRLPLNGIHYRAT